MDTVKIKDPTIVAPVKDPIPITDTAAVSPPKTTAEENRHSLGQRGINLLWETTQSRIALSIIWGALATAIFIVVADPDNRIMAFLFISNIVSTVIGFYFGRTNHQKVGGVDLGR